MFCENYEGFTQELEKRMFTVHSAETGAQAKEIALSLMGSAVVGCGGSATAISLGMHDALRKQGATVYFHGEVAPEERPAVFAKCATAEWYLCSTNAITRKGQLVNIDNTGNRVAAMAYGPKKVLIIVGKNKFAETLDEAMDRVKKYACVGNARRYNLSTPCALTGECANCYSPQRLCSVTTITEQKPRAIGEFHIILVDEELGF
ncbi:MAG: lactate utilization protein [Clostridia bacterium]|nr:lactate utilization protein [Clostridia bacterium]